MKVELKDAKVELEVREGKASISVNGQQVPISREVGVSLIFGDGVVKYMAPEPSRPPTKTAPAQERKTGCQSAASKKKLSESLKRFHAKRRKAEQTKGKSKLNGKSHLNGASAHMN